MKTRTWRPWVAAWLLGMAPLAAQGNPQGAGSAAATWTTHVSHVVPNGRTLGAHAGVQATSVHARIDLLEGVARTTLEIYLRNPAPRMAEAKLLVPLPRQAAVTGFDFQGTALEPTAELLDVDEARRTYQGIVAQLRDPALLEFAGTALLRSSVFPVPPHGEQVVRIVFEQVLEDGQSYMLPRSEQLTGATPWHLQVHAAEGHVYSPSHALESSPGSDGRVLTSTPASTRQPGPVRLVHLRAGKGSPANSLLAHPDPQGGGHFLLVATPPPSEARVQEIARSVTFVIDRSGSMAGGKLAQAVAGVRRLASQLRPEETFNVIDYGSQAGRFSTQPVAATPENRQRLFEYLARLLPSGGTNMQAGIALGLESAWSEAVQNSGRLSLLVLLSDGVPTVGERKAQVLRELAQQAPQGLVSSSTPRIFTVGIGNDVDAPLLDGLASDSRAIPTYILPGEDISMRMDGLAQQLRGPRWADLEWKVRGPRGNVISDALVDVHPTPLPDVFHGQALIILGRYTRAGSWRGTLAGRTPEGELWVEFPLDLRAQALGGQASVANSFVPRLWAYREISFLVDQLRGAEDSLSDAARGELREEILRLSTRYGVLSEYTAFLATEGTDIGFWEGMVSNVDSNLRRAEKPRSGEWAVNQSRNMLESRGKAQLDYWNGHWSPAGERKEFRSVQQLADGAFLSVQGTSTKRWVDTRLVVNGQANRAPARVLTPKEPDYARLLTELEREGRSAWLSLQGDVLLARGHQTWLIRNGQP